MGRISEKDGNFDRHWFSTLTRFLDLYSQLSLSLLYVSDACSSLSFSFIGSDQSESQVRITNFRGFFFRALFRIWIPWFKACPFFVHLSDPPLSLSEIYCVFSRFADFFIFNIYFTWYSLICVFSQNPPVIVLVIAVLHAIDLDII